MKKISHKKAKGVFSENGCELLEQYVGIRIPMKYRCQCGTISKTSLHAFKQGRRCKNCGSDKRADKRRIDYKEIQDYFSKQDCELLSDSYRNCDQLLEYRCSCGNISKISFSNFKAGHKCKKCSLRYGSKNHKWNPNREEVRLAESFRKRCYNLLHRSLAAVHMQKRSKTINLLGYTPSELRQWIMGFDGWEDIRGSRWHLDHIFPIKAFIDYGVTDLKLINCLENLRPVTTTDNLKKQGVYSKEKFEAWLTSKGVYDIKK